MCSFHGKLVNIDVHDSDGRNRRLLEKKTRHS